MTSKPPSSEVEEDKEMKEEEEEEDKDEEDKDEEDEIDIECLRGALCETAAIDFTILARCTAIAFCLSRSDNDR